MRAERPYNLSAAVLLLGIVLSGLLAWGSHSLYVDSENQQLQLRVRDAGSLISAALPAIQTPLASAAAIAASSPLDAAKFSNYAGAYVGHNKQFASMSLWHRRGTTYTRVATLGAAQDVSAARARTVLGRARSAPLLSLSYITSGTPGIGYSVAAGSSRDVIVYAESPLPANHRLAIASDSAFSDFQYALYVETTAKHPYLLATSEQHLPLSGQQATERIPFGDATFVLDMSPRGPLEGSFFANFAWIVGGAGLAVAIGAAVMTERLSHRRRLAEQIAAQLERIAKENERLYDEQRTIAETLQHALLPDVLPDVDGLETRARYVAGSLDVDVGGDWYDVVRLEDGRALVVVGDVSGRGVKAAAVMASLRFATRAYALQGDSPATILSKLSWHLSIAESGHFATAVCVLVDVAGHSLTFTNAGHPPPLLAVDGTGAYLDGNVGIPIGIVSNPSYETTTVPVPPDATVLLFTDGLVERRGETLDVGLEKLRDAVVGSKGSLDDVLSDLESGLMPERLDDDTAMVGLRWTK